MTKDTTDPVFDTFFENVINAKDHKTLKAWLKKQHFDEMKYFLYTYSGWNNRGSEQALLRIEIERRESKHSSRQRWRDRAIGGLGTFALGLLIAFLTNHLGWN